MYRLKFIPEKKVYQIHSSEYGAYEGSLTQVTEKALEMGVQGKEITLAYEIMDKNKHTKAEFGLNGCFLYSK